jgi:phospholipid/cholesterol/gamma-HCH transport system substrate-binding protein
MQRSLFTELKVGVFVSIGLILAMVVIFMLGSETRFLHRQYTLYSNFEDISGLREGAPVQLAGVKVGFVDGIRVPKELKTRQITVVMQINKQYQDRIRADSTASIETQGLLGDKFIYVTMGSESQPIIPNKGILPSKITTSIFALGDKAGEIMDNISETSKSINEILKSIKGKEGESDIKSILSSMKASLEQIEKGKGFLHALIYDPKGEQVVADLSRAMKAVGDVVAKADEKEGAGGILVNMRRASADLRNILESVRRGEGTLGKLVTDPALYDDLRALFGRANRNALLRAVVRSTIEENDRQMLK